jgi:hypothetical protein
VSHCSDSGATTENFDPQITIADSSGSMEIAGPTLAANIDTSGAATEGVAYTLPLELSGTDTAEVDGAGQRCRESLMGWPGERPRARREDSRPHCRPFRCSLSAELLFQPHRYHLQNHRRILSEADFVT